jgi:hypothetical protein
VAPKLKPTAGDAAASAGFVDAPNKLLAGDAAGLASSVLATFPNRLLDWKTDAGFGVSESDAAGAAPNNVDVDFAVSSEVAGFAPNDGLSAGLDVSAPVGGLAPKSVDDGVAFSGSEAAGFAPKIEAVAGLGVSDSVAAGFAPNIEAEGVAAGFSSAGLAWPKTDAAPDGFEPKPPNGVDAPEPKGEVPEAGADGVAPNNGDDAGFGCSAGAAGFSTSFDGSVSFAGVGGSRTMAGAEDEVAGFWAKSEPAAFGAAEPKIALGCDDVVANLMGVSVLQVLLAGVVLLSFDGLAGLSLSGDEG